MHSIQNPTTRKVASLKWQAVTQPQIGQHGLTSKRLIWLANAAVDRGEWFLGGALANPADGAVIAFSGDSPAVAETFAKADPYVRNGLVKEWRVREWNTVIGHDAANPL